MKKIELHYKPLNVLIHYNNVNFFAHLHGFYLFQYLELRFSKGVRLAACLTFILQMVSYMSTLNAASATIRKSSNNIKPQVQAKIKFDLLMYIIMIIIFIDSSKC